MSFLDRFKKQAPVGAKPKNQTAKTVADSATSAATSSAPTKPSKEDTKEAYRVLLHPIVSEKAARVALNRQYAFAVPISATRIGVARAITALYGVRSSNVNIIRVKGKRVRFGRVNGKQKDWKKAIITLKHGESISVFEGV